MTTDREERIRQLAHSIWEGEGRPHGRDAEHWRAATEAYEAEVAVARLDDAGQPIDEESRALRGQPKRRPAPTSVGDTSANLPATRQPASKRKRRTKAEMAAAAAGVAGAAAAVVATVAVTKRRRGTKAGMLDDSAPTPTADAALRRPRKSMSDTSPSKADPASAAVASDAAAGAIPDTSANMPRDAAPGPVADPGAESPSGTALETISKGGSDADPSAERIAD